LITIFASRNASMWRNGSPLTVMTSANFPWATDSGLARGAYDACGVERHLANDGHRIHAKFAHPEIRLHPRCLPGHLAQLPTSVPKTISTPRSRIWAIFRFTIALISS
jgi:hypothetical protein